MSEEMDSLLGKWEFVSAENNEEFDVATGFPKGTMAKVNSEGASLTYEKLAEGRYKNYFVNPALGNNESEFVLNQKHTNKANMGGTEFEITVEASYEGNGVWKEIQTFPGGKVVEEIKQFSGDTMTMKYTTNGVTGTAIYKRA